jgi:hypothetical protein
VSTDDTNVPDWLYLLFTGASYPYIKRQAKFRLKRDPTPDILRELFVDIFPRCTMKVLVEEKQGMIVQFRELETYEPGKYMDLVWKPIDVLREAYGRGKYKLNFYEGENFICTTNFKVDME